MHRVLLMAMPQGKQQASSILHLASTPPTEWKPVSVSLCRSSTAFRPTFFFDRRQVPSSFGDGMRVYKAQDYSEPKPRVPCFYRTYVSVHTEEEHITSSHKNHSHTNTTPTSAKSITWHSQLNLCLWPWTLMISSSSSSP